MTFLQRALRRPFFCARADGQSQGFTKPVWCATQPRSNRRRPRPSAAHCVQESPERFGAV